MNDWIEKRTQQKLKEYKQRRERIATAALQAVIASEKINYEGAASISVMYADALINVLDTENR